MAGWIGVLIEIRDTSVPVVILQSEPYALHHGGLGIARSVGRLGIRVYWVHGLSWAPPTLSRYVYERVLWNADARPEELVESLLELGRRIGHESILIPIDDRGAIFVADQAEALRERFLLPNQPIGLARSLSDKRELYFLCKKVGIPTPEASFPRSRDDVVAFVQTAVFPVVMKRIATWLPEHRAQIKSVTIVHSPQELLEEYEQITKLNEPNVMLQEYIPGGPESVWMFNGFFTNRSECLVGFTGHKIRQAPPFTGATTLGICLENETVEETTKDFMRQVGYSGIIDMEYRFDGRDGQYKLLDVNPRAGATFRLFVDSSGLDVVRALYLDLAGQSVPRGVARVGRKWIVEQSDLMTSLRYRRLGKLTLTKWAGSLRGIEEGAWFAGDDLVPLAAMCCSSLAKVGRMVRGRTTKHA
jgi:predicted ATP-grasp superfamily ATP-dependent carboligase